MMKLQHVKYKYNKEIGRASFIVYFLSPVFISFIKSNFLNKEKNGTNF